MKIIIQRVSSASVVINGNVQGAIGKGFLLLVGIEHEDTQADADWLAHKVGNLRIFNDDQGMMNLSLDQVNGDILSISQFTLHASYKKGNRPSFIQAAKPELATNLYDYFNLKLETIINKKVFTGIFGEDMKVNLINDGPVTIIMDSKDPK